MNPFDFPNGIILDKFRMKQCLREIILENENFTLINIYIYSHRDVLNIRARYVE